MQFDPIQAAQEIVESYKDYVHTTFFIRDNEFRNQFERIIDQNELSKGPYIDCVDAFETGESVADLVSEKILSSEFLKLDAAGSNDCNRPLYRHQIEAITRGIEQHNLVITTGTGSGKTEAFLYPILNHLFRLKEESDHVPRGVHALLLFPMNALANDQMKRLRVLLKNYPAITFGAYTGETIGDKDKASRAFREINHEEPLPNELISRDEMKDAGPNILVTNYAMLEYLLIRPADNGLFHGPHSGHWKFVVLDEAHTYHGATGMETAILIRRLVQNLHNSDAIRFFLTSATLGDEETNEAVRTFASNLCAESFFGPNSVIRATRIIPRKPDQCISIDPSLFPRIEQIAADVDLGRVQKISYIKELIGDLHVNADGGGDLSRFLYEVLSQDEFYYQFRRVLESGDCTIAPVAQRLEVTSQQLISFITLASIAAKERTKLLDIRYHQFVRTIEGAYVTFRPQKTLSVEPRTEAVFEGETYRAFELSVCQYCGTMYIGGKKIHNALIQSKTWPTEYYMIPDQEFFESSDEDEDEDSIEKRSKHRFVLCAKCGSITNAFSTTAACGCTSKDKIEVYLVKGTENVDEEDTRTELHKCAHCNTVNPRGSILRGFYIGQNAAAAVIGSSLYEQMPLRTITKERKVPSMGKERTVMEEKETKQLLIFSDNRQEAAFFAPYFEFTYQSIQRRRLIYRATRELAEFDEYSGNHGIPLPRLAAELARKLQIHHISEPEESEREAWKALLYEIRGGDRNGLSNLGLLTFSFDSKFQAGYPPFEELQELALIDEILMSHFMKEGAVTVPDSVQFTPADISTFMFHDSMAAIAFGPKPTQQLKRSKNAIVYWISHRNNSRMDFLRKTGRFSSDDEIKSFLKEHLSSHAESLGHDGDLTWVSDGYRLKSDRIVVRADGIHQLQWYRCDRCGRLTSKNLGNLCPHFRCDGFLVAVSSDFLGGYHRRKLTEGSLFPMHVKEHTAQLSHDTARKYQHQFISGDINVLSSSTTFEMGVDVGELETVFMRNMPPSPSNYTQRAGRAGRRVETAAFALTFSRLANHDLAYFRDPVRMINGRISPPVFKLDNEKIVKRHIYATLLASFWRRHPDIKTVEEIFSDPVWSDFVHFLHNLPAELMELIHAFTPASISQDSALRIIEEYRREKGHLWSVREKYRAEVADIDQLISDAIADEQYERVKPLKRVRTNIASSRIIEFFSRNGLIPKYGFPVDTVELQTDLTGLYNTQTSRSGLKLQRDLYQAISEYAPGSQVIADGYLYTSQYIRPPFRRDETWRQYEYGICKNDKCGMLNVQLYHEETSLTGKTGECKFCGAEYPVKGVFIVPAHGFVVSPKPPAEALTKPPSRGGRTAVYYTGDALGKKQKRSVFRYREATISITTSENDQLAVISKASFAVCHSCGYAERNIKHQPVKKLSNSHKTPYGKDCKNHTLYNKSLGHVFRTDVAMVAVDHYLDHDEAYSILYTLLEGMNRYFDIDRDDIDGAVSRDRQSNGTWHTVFVLFDKVPGGAGHTSRLGELNPEQFQLFVQSSLQVVKNCSCGDQGDGNAACYSCLCNYSNQNYHDILKRKYAVDFLSALDHLPGLGIASVGDAD